MPWCIAAIKDSSWEAVTPEPEGSPEVLIFASRKENELEKCNGQQVEQPMFTAAVELPRVITNLLPHSYIPPGQAPNRLIHAPTRDWHMLHMRNGNNRQELIFYLIHQLKR